MAELRLDQVTKAFGETVAVDGVELTVGDGEFLALLGPSGCGKTTILRLVAGFEQLTGGAIRFNGTVVSDARVHLPPEQRRVGIVFQSYALWPHMTVAHNVGYPLKVVRVRGDAYRRRVDEALALVGLDGLADRRPAQLSGGQRQRVALARCFVMAPPVVLLDEPLANLDVHLRAAMQNEFVAFHRKISATMIYITHDQGEAMAMAHRIAVMDHGRLQQVAPPQTLYAEPATAMVADFVGQGVVVAGAVVGANGGHAGVTLWGADIEARCAPGQAAGPADLSLRPEGLRLTANGDGIAARVKRATYRGGVHAVEVAPEAAPGAHLVLAVPQPPAAGALVHVAVDDAWVIPAD